MYVIQITNIRLVNTERPQTIFIFKMTFLTYIIKRTVNFGIIQLIFLLFVQFDVYEMSC